MWCLKSFGYGAIKFVIKFNLEIPDEVYFPISRFRCSISNSQGLGFVCSLIPLVSPHTLRPPTHSEENTDRYIKQPHKQKNAFLLERIKHIYELHNLTNLQASENYLLSSISNVSSDFDL